MSINHLHPSGGAAHVLFFHVFSRRPVNRAVIRLDMTSTNDEHRQLLEYFETLAAQTSRREFVRGASLTREWLALRRREDITQELFDEFMHRIEDFDACGSGYFDLWLRVRHWGYSLGLLVPEQHPWTVDRRVITCTDNRAFEQQLTVGKEYTILSCDDDRLLVRVVNDIVIPIRH